jgi:2-haloacid dehalogenase
MRWHQVLSAEDAGTYKPDPAIYELAMRSVPTSAGPPFMVAAHAWDLRAAAAIGMRTAYVPRPNGDPPRPDDEFDVVATSLTDLHARLVASAA